MVSIYGIPNLSLDKAPLEIREVGSRSLAGNAISRAPDFQKSINRENPTQNRVYLHPLIPRNALSFDFQPNPHLY